jgi:hypothetical protein
MAAAARREPEAEQALGEPAEEGGVVVRGRWIAWCATAGLWLGVPSVPGSARAQDDAPVDASESAGERGAREGDRALRRVAGTLHMEVLARDLRLTDANAERLKRIATRYYKATRERLVVTGGTRTPQRQARLMYDKLKHGDDIVAQYENKQAAAEIRKVYREGVAGRLSRARLLRAIKGVIEAQMARGVFVSKHLQSGAVDVRSWNMEGEREEALREAVKQEPGVTLLDERSGPEPHFHLNLLAARQSVEAR